MPVRMSWKKKGAQPHTNSLCVQARDAEPKMRCPACGGRGYTCDYCEDGSVTSRRVEVVKRQMKVGTTEKIG